MGQALDITRQHARRLARRAVLRLVRPQAAIQSAVNADLSARLAQESERRAAGELLATQLRRAGEGYERRLTRAEDLLREVVITAEMQRRGLAAAEQAVRRLDQQLQTPGPPVTAPLELFEDPVVGRVLGYRAAAPARAPGGLPLGTPVYLELLSEHAPVVELACGRGELLARLADAGVPASGCEPEPERLAVAQADMRLAVEPAEALEYLQSLAGGSAGAVFCAGLSAPELQRVLAEVPRVLAPGGILLAELPNSGPGVEAMLAAAASAGFPTAQVFAPGHADWPAARAGAPVYALLARAQPL